VKICEAAECEPLTELFEKTRGLLAKVAPRVIPSVRRGQEGAHLDLPTPPGADYRFSLGTGEPQIRAILSPPSEDRYFWYWPFEAQDYSSLSEQEDHFLGCVRLILLSPTRITQRRRSLGTSFNCEATSERGHEPIGGTLGAWFRTPRITGRHHTWWSPPVVSAD
jgi:hypothetical protein